MDDAFSQNALSTLFEHLNKKFVKLELSEKEFENELKSIEYPTNYTSYLYQLLFKQQSIKSVTLNKETLSNQSIFDSKIKLLSLFLEFDEDHNESISNDEFRKALERQGFDDLEIESMFEKIDEDGNGDISFNEFTQFFEDMVVQQAEQEKLQQDQVFTSQSEIDPGFNESKTNPTNHKLNGTISEANYYNVLVKEDELTQLLTKFQNNEMHFSDNIAASDREIMSSLMEMIINLSKDRTMYETQINNINLNSETLSQECELIRSQNMRLIQENQLIAEQMNDLKHDLERQKAKYDENSRILRAAKKTNTSGGVSAIGGKGADTPSVGPVASPSTQKQRRSSLLNENEILFLTDEYDKQQMELTRLTQELEKKQNELKSVTDEFGEVERLEKENNEMRNNLTQLTNKFEKENKQLNQTIQKLTEEAEQMKEYVENLETDLQNERAKHTQEMQRMSVQMEQTKNTAKLKSSHSRNDTALGLKRRMKTMNLDAMFNSINGGIESLFDATNGENAVNVNENIIENENENDNEFGNEMGIVEFDDPFYQSAVENENPTIEELEQNVVDLENENEELNNKIQKQQTENFENVSKLEEVTKELEDLKIELQKYRKEGVTGTGTETGGTMTGDDDTFVSQHDQKAGKMTVDDESSDERDDDGNGKTRKGRDERIDINPSNDSFAGACWICCGFKII